MDNLNVFMTCLREDNDIINDYDAQIKPNGNMQTKDRVACERELFLGTNSSVVQRMRMVVSLTLEAELERHQENHRITCLKAFKLSISRVILHQWNRREHGEYAKCERDTISIILLHGNKQYKTSTFYLN